MRGLVLGLMLLLAAPVASAGWYVASSDTGEGQLTVWHDYWNQDRRSHMGDHGEFFVTVQAPEPGEYTWRIKDAVASNPNPLRGLFASFVVYDRAGDRLGDLVAEPAQAVPFEAREDHRFRIEFELAHLAADEYNQLRREVDENRATRNETARPHEVHGWVSLVQVSSEDEEPAEGTSLAVRHGLDLAMMFQLPSDAFALTSTDGGGAQGTVLIDGQRYVVVYGPTYHGSDDTAGTLTVEGDLADRQILFFLDDTDQNLQAVGEGGTNRPAVWVPGLEGIDVLLPGGAHQLIYLVPTTDGEPPISGTVTLRERGGHALITDDVRIDASSNTLRWWWVALPLALAGGVALVAVLLRRRNATAEEGAARPESPANAPAQAPEPRETDGVMRF